MPRYFIQKITDLVNVLIQSKIVLLLKKKYPASFQFIYQRMSIEKFKGLPLTILVTSICFNLLLLIDFVNDVVYSKKSISIDTNVSEWLYRCRSESVAEFFFWASKICNFPIVIAVAGVICFYFFFKRNKNYAIGIIISLIGSALTVFIGKVFFAVNRPMKYAYYFEDTYSFPSGHATIVVAFYGLLFYFLGRRTVEYKKWIILIITAFIFIFLVGFSRLYLGVHYLSDVVIGYLLGLLWLLLSISIVEWQEH